ncbi:DUF4136 domain-containing protein [Ferrimonas balearica]|uniref:DUF4136 domain-containing protein n=1 Tax=Ferrimonas balearica TaxID=44012 RepID=UPI001C997373|nr:DUF4136 domain-containing protein [Ferrimonas balearica]MBY5992174.1 DUF4136 domain-containing protein [Ferrimonas balearica]
MKHLAILLSALVIFGCSSNSVSLDYNSQTDFNAINRYALLAPDEGLDPLMDKRIRTAIAEQLEAKGWQALAEGDVQLSGDAVAIAYQAWQETRSRDSGMTIGVGGGRSSGNSSIGGSVAIPVGDSTRKVQVIRIDMVQAGQLIWRASDDFNVSDRDSPEKRNERTQELVTRLLAQFPPQ